MNRQLVHRTVAALAFVAAPVAASAQQTTTTTPSTTTVSMPIEFSGVLYPQFIYGGQKGNGTRSANQFQLERAYLTARGKVADRTSFRLTADVFRPGAGAGYTMRAKYAYVQYDYATNNEGLFGTNGQARLGMQQTVIIDQEEQIWPRWIAPTSTDRAGYFPSSDLGLSTTIGFGKGRTEVFAMVANGPGYAQPEVDRFKDYQARVSIKLLGDYTQPTGGLLIAPWYYKGTVASGLQPARGRKRDRYGVLAAWKSQVLTLGGQLARATNQNEALALNGTNVVTTDKSGRLLSLYTVVKPFVLLNPTSGNKTWGAVFRYDDFTGDNGYVPSPGAFAVAEGHFLIAGLIHDVNNRLSLSLDWQQQSPKGVAAPNLDLRTYNLHAMVAF